jgi:hypothetical protein
MSSELIGQNAQLRKEENRKCLHVGLLPWLQYTRMSPGSNSGKPQGSNDLQCAVTALTVDCGEGRFLNAVVTLLQTRSIRRNTRLAAGMHTRT